VPGTCHTHEGELLWPDHYPEPALAQLEHNLGSFRAAGQLQQRPAALEGELLKRGWWHNYDPSYTHPDKIAMLPAFTHIVASWDTAFENKTTSDYVVGQVWGVAGADRYLLYSFRRHANLRATIQAMREAHRWVEQRWPRAPHTILVEKSANGAEIVAELKRELPGVLPVIVSTDKIARAIAATPPLEAGNVFLPGLPHPTPRPATTQPDWVASFIEEAAMFPNARHDDQGDAYSQAMNWRSANGPNGSSPRSSFLHPSRLRAPGRSASKALAATTPTWR
jgi:predicted phage terminase large subunit-like protein